MDPFVVATVALAGVTATPYLVYVALYLAVQPRPIPGREPDVEPTVSVVLPTFNEAEIIERKLQELVSLDYPSGKLEIVVVDSSDDETPDVVREFFAGQDEPRLTLVEEDQRRGVASAVNSAVTAADGELIFRTDCDSELAPDVVDQAVATLTEEEVRAVTGRQADVLGESAVESDYRDLLSLVQAVETYLDSTFIAHGPCFAFERAAFRPLKPDTVADDTETAVGIRRRGGRVAMNPRMRFAESGTSRFGKRRRRKDRRALGLIQTLWRNRDLVGRYGRYGRVVLPFNWWFLVLSPWLMVVVGALGVAAAVVVLGPPGVAIPAIGLLGMWLGQRDRLGPLQPIYAIVDSQVSLLIGGVKLALWGASETWEIDRESRGVFE